MRSTNTPTGDRTATTRGSTATATREWDPWTYTGGPSWHGSDLVGYKVESLDGEIGKVDEATDETGKGFIVVNTGGLVFGKKVLLPAGVIARIDEAEKKVFVNRTMDEIKSAPKFDETQYRDRSYREQVGSYYGPEGHGWRERDTHESIF